MKLKIFALGILLFCVCSTIYGQSCGSGTATFHVFDESGLTKINDYYVSLHIVSEDQDWRVKDFSRFGWKRQIFDDTTHKKHENPRNYRKKLELAFEIPLKEYSRLMQNRADILKKNPNSIVAQKTDQCQNPLQNSASGKKPFRVCTVEGCSFMVVAEIQADGYETAYFVSDFTCSCSKNYEFRLNRKREKCLEK